MCFFLATEKSSSPALLKFPVTISLWKEQSKLFQIADLIREMSCFGKKKVFRIVPPPQTLYITYTHQAKNKKNQERELSRLFTSVLDGSFAFRRILLEEKKLKNVSYVLFFEKKNMIISLIGRWP